MLRKIFTVFIIALLLLQISPTFAQDYSSKAHIMARNELQSTKNGKGYVSQLEKALTKMSDEQISQIQKRVQALSTGNTQYSREQKALLNYISLSLEQESLTRGNPASALSLIEIEATSTPLADTTKKSIETEILSAQKSLSNELISLMQDSLTQWTDITNYQELGNLDAKLNINLTDIADIKSSLKVKNYTLKNKAFDQQLNAQIEAVFDASLSGENIQVSMNSLIDFITTDGNMYLLLDKLQVKNSDTSLDLQAQSTIKKLQELAKTRTYVQVSDTQSADVTALLQQLNPKNIEAELQKSAQILWLSPVESAGKSYRVVPTQAFCTIMKQTLAIFDPFSGSSCTASQYKNMLDDLEEMGMKFYYTPGAQKGLSMSIDSDDISGSMKLLWNTDSIISLSGKFTNPSEPKTKLSFAFFPKKSFESVFQAPDILMQANALLTKTGGIQDMTVKANIDEFTMLITLKDTKFNMSANMLAGSDTLSCKASGMLSENISEITGSCDIQSSLLTMIAADSKGALKLNFGIKSDMTGEKNNSSFYILGKTGTKNIFDFTVNQTANRTSELDINIVTPTKVESLEKVMEEIYESGY